MKIIALVLIAASGLLSSCIAYEVPVADRGASHQHRGYPPDRDYRGPYRGDYDRDHDGVPNRRDRAPDNPYRY